ncbi:MAG TPA: outer membrane protein assembly factor BamB [Crenotrichaceae bacterium]|nr:outer membrane protein assembly factor BamB [Crenotrichaceae bacterium]
MQRYGLLFVIFLLTGCGTLDGLKESVSDATGLFNDGVDPRKPNDLKALETSLNKHVIWEVDTGVGTNEQSVNLQPTIIDDESIVTADREGVVQRRSLDSGKLIWEKELDLPLSAAVGVDTFNFYVGSSNGYVVALSQEDGSVVWKVNVPSEVLAIPQSDDSTVVIRTIDGQVIGLDEDTGKQRWTYKQPVPALSLRGTSTPALYQGAAICGFARGRLIALRIEDGLPIWQTVVAIPTGRSELDRMVDLDADPVIDEDTLFVASYQGGVAAVVLASGEPLWQQTEVSVQSGITVDWQALYVSDENGDVWVLNRDNGRTFWKQDALHFRELTTPVLYRDTLVVGDFEGYVHWLSQEDGRLLDRKKISDERILAKPLVLDDILYIYASDGQLTALTVK